MSNNMNLTRSTNIFDYTNIPREDIRYFGIHKIADRVSIDTARYKHILEEDGAIEFLPNGLLLASSSQYFTPAYKCRHDYKINLFCDLIDELKREWFEEYRPLFKHIKTPKQVYESNRLEQMMYTSCSDDLDEIECTAMLEAIYREPRYARAIHSLYCNFISKISTEIDRIILIVITDLGYKSSDFNFNAFAKFSDGLQKDKNGEKISKLKKYNAFNLLHKINNFLKHNTVTSYNDLKKWYPKNVASIENGTAKVNYENGMFAGDWIIIEKDYIDNLFDKLIIFFKDYCKKYLMENVDDADWNYDEYFINVYNKIVDLKNYWGI